MEAALRLFAQQGYDETTIDQIAEAAEISRRTFFSYFPSKEDLLFAGMHRRAEAILRGIEARAPHEPMIDVLTLAAEEMAGHPWDGDPDGDLGRIEIRLIHEVPALQARALYRLSVVEARIAEALQEAYPEASDQITVPALVGAVVRAATVSAMTAVQQGRTIDEVRDEVCRTVHIVGDGLRFSLSQAERHASQTDRHGSQELSGSEA
ncbi:MAG: hypothetical protein QG622_673 [Actinomycetota bacterium]|nr:hypothetical protein [Actinomycetota bacterium]